MRPLSLLLALALALALTLPLPLASQTPARGKPLGSWEIDYDRIVLHMHGEPTRLHERGRMTLSAVGDSLIGELVVGDSAAAERSLVRGVSGKTGWTLIVEEPPAKGFGIFFSAIGAAMDWMRETVHGITPVTVRFDLTAKGDSLTGNRIASGGLSSTPRTSAVRGIRTKP